MSGQRYKKVPAPDTLVPFVSNGGGDVVVATLQSFEYMSLTNMWRIEVLVFGRVFIHYVNTSSFSRAYEDLVDTLSQRF